MAEKHVQLVILAAATARWTSVLTIAQTEKQTSSSMSGSIKQCYFINVNKRTGHRLKKRKKPQGSWGQQRCMTVLEMMATHSRCSRDFAGKKTAVICWNACLQKKKQDITATQYWHVHSMSSAPHSVSTWCEYLRMLSEKIKYLGMDTVMKFATCFASKTIIEAFEQF